MKHIIRKKDGGTRQVNLTPLKAIRYQCLECMGWVYKEVDNCTSPLCSLFPYRFGHRPKGDDAEDTGILPEEDDGFEMEGQQGGNLPS